MTFDRASSYHDTITRRRELVARLRLRGMTVREIADMVAKSGIVNTKTGEPFTFQTIQNDLEALRLEWQENASQDTDVHKARQLAEIDQIKRLAWQNNDGSLALNAIDKEMKLLGTSAPIKFAVSLSVIEEWASTMRAVGQNPEQVLKRMTERARAEHVH